MIEEEVLGAVRDRISTALTDAGIDARVSVGFPSRPLPKDSDTLRVYLEDAGSRDLETIDQAPGYRAEIEIRCETYRSSAAAAGARAVIGATMRSFYIATSDRHSGPWRSRTGWDVLDRGSHRFSAIVFSARVYSRDRVLERLGIAP